MNVIFREKQCEAVKLVGKYFRQVMRTLNIFTLFITSSEKPPLRIIQSHKKPNEDFFLTDLHYHFMDTSHILI